MVLIDMHQPGVEARPLKQMTGNEEFGEVFFTDARVPVDQVLGEVGGGWGVAMLLLSFERGSSAMGQYTAFRANSARSSTLRGRPAAGAAPSPRIRCCGSGSPRRSIELEALKLHSLHILTKVERGEELGFESSMTKLQWSETHQDIGEVYMDVVGPDGLDHPGDRRQQGTSCTRSRRARCGRVRRRSGAARRRCSATSSPSTCSACPASRSLRRRRTVEFALTDEQRALQDTVRVLPARPLRPGRRARGLRRPRRRRQPGRVCGRRSAEQGWLAVLVPEEHDGLGLGLLDAAVIVRCLGAGVVPSAYTATLLAAEAIRLAGSRSSRRRGCRGWRPERYGLRSRCAARAATGRCPARRSRLTATS